MAGQGGVRGWLDKEVSEDGWIRRVSRGWFDKEGVRGWLDKVSEGRWKGRVAR